ncbi:hypothetical protein Tco_1132871 [Tanacetum coccineum]|uniref:Uncharacterized protein n=1 Tax=Tanacetum coccineum TaxID=301880 RepID=A0ABQ5JEV3_9ASTR
MELVLEQTQQGTSYEVSVSAEGVEELKRKVKIKGEKKEALITLRQKLGFGIESSNSMESDISSGDETLTDSAYENFKREKAYKAVPPPTGTIIPPRANVSFTGIDELAIRNKSVNQRKTKLSQSAMIEIKSRVPQAVLSDSTAWEVINPRMDKLRLESKLLTIIEVLYYQGLSQYNIDPRNYEIFWVKKELRQSRRRFKDYTIIDKWTCSGSMTGDKGQLTRAWSTQKPFTSCFKGNLVRRLPSKEHSCLITLHVWHVDKGKQHRPSCKED